MGCPRLCQHNSECAPVVHGILVPRIDIHRLSVMPCTFITEEPIVFIVAKYGRIHAWPYAAYVGQ